MKELPRRLWHILGGLSVPAGGFWAPQDIFVPSLISITLAAIGLEIIRCRSPQVNQRFMFIFRALLRGNENSAPTASTYFLVAASTVFVLCDRSVAALALAFAALGDPVAGMVGERWGRVWLTSLGVSPRGSFSLPQAKQVSSQLKGKSLEGSAACLLICLLFGLGFTVLSDLSLWLVVIGAICATAVELFSLRTNDNLSIPLVTAGVMNLILYLPA